MYAIVIHGGAGDWPAQEWPAALTGVRNAAEAGIGILAARGSALDAVVAAVVMLEEDPTFNAGTGACLNIDGEVELDASVMVGDGLRAGGVAALQRVRNPVLVARKVMEETDHVLLAGQGAQDFARTMGFADYDPVTAQARARHEERRAKLLSGQLHTLPRLRRRLLFDCEPRGGTVGALALDKGGILAAATSTGGVTLKLRGRVGDSPIPGAGNYASDCAAASATGHGELVLRALATKVLCDRIAGGLSAKQAAHSVLRELAKDTPAGVGLIALARSGDIGIIHDTPAMPHAWFRAGSDVITVAMHATSSAGD